MLADEDRHQLIFDKKYFLLMGINQQIFGEKIEQSSGNDCASSRLYSFGASINDWITSSPSHQTWKYSSLSV